MTRTSLALGSGHPWPYLPGQLDRRQERLRLQRRDHLLQLLDLMGRQSWEDSFHNFDEK